MYNDDSEEEVENKVQQQQSQPLTSISKRSGQLRKRTQQLQEGIEQGLGITSFKATANEEHEEYYKVMHEDDYKLQDQMLDPIAFKLTGNPDDLYYHQALKKPITKSSRKQ